MTNRRRGIFLGRTRRSAMSSIGVGHCAQRLEWLNDEQSYDDQHGPIRNDPGGVLTKVLGGRAGPVPGPVGHRMPASPGADQPYLGILLMLGFCMLVPLADAGAKYLGPTVPLLQLLLARFVLQWLALLPMTWIGERTLHMSRRILWLTLLRTMLHIVGIGAMFVSLQYLPLADTIAIAFVMPLLLLMLGHFVLGEYVGRSRLAACVVGFVGTLLVVQPSFAEVGAPALLPLLVAITFAAFMLTTRPIARRIDPISLQIVSGLIGTALLVVVYIAGSFTDWPAFATTLPTRFDSILLVSVSLLGTVAHLLMTWALRLAPSTTLAPMQYLEIPVATIVGWLIFRDIPNGLAAIGIAITMVTGLYIVLSERRTARSLSGRDSET